MWPKKDRKVDATNPGVPNDVCSTLEWDQHGVATLGNVRTDTLFPKLS